MIAHIIAKIHFSAVRKTLFPLLPEGSVPAEADSPIFLSSTLTESFFTLAESRSTVRSSVLFLTSVVALDLVRSVTFSNLKVSPASFWVMVIVFVSITVSLTSTSTTSLTVSRTSSLVSVVRLCASVAFLALAQAVKHRAVVTMSAVVNPLDRIAQLGYLVL